MKWREIIYIVTIVALASVVVTMLPGKTALSESRHDTVVVYRTIRDTVLSVRAVRLERIDTVWLTAARDTVSLEVEMPIEQKTYLTEDYRAVVEGFHPRLAEIEVYRNTVYIDRTQTSPLKRPAHWGVGVHAGYGFTPSGCMPYIGVGLQYNIITW